MAACSRSSTTSLSPADVQPLHRCPLKAPPPPPSQPIVPPGVAHAQVDAPITYDAKATPNPAQPGAAGPPPDPKRTVCAGDPAKLPPGALVECAQITSGPADTHTETPQVQTQIPAVQPAMQEQGGFFHSIGRFFSR